MIESLLLSLCLLFGNDGSAFDPYFQSLALHVEKFESTYIDTFFLQKQNFHPSYSESISGIPVRSLTPSEIFEKTSKKQNIRLTVISPLTIEDGEMCIYVTNYIVSRKRKKYYPEASDATKVKFSHRTSYDNIILEKVY